MLYPNGLTTRPDTTQTWRSYPGHNGEDQIHFDYNHAIDDGVVIFSAYNGTAGNEVRVRHASGDVSRYLHGARNLVQVGTAWAPTRVSRGQRLQVQ